MPPSLSQDGDNILAKSPEQYYTNEDVTILHDIVVYAQELLPSLSEQEKVPTNALFHAYYAILPSIGIDVDHDSRYARILFKIGGMRGDRTLYEKFELVLSRMGIEIQLEHGDSNEECDNKSESQAYQGSGPRSQLDPAPEGANQTTRRHRRNSEGSLWDVTDGHDEIHRKRRRSFSSLSKRPSPHDIEFRNETRDLDPTDVHAIDQTLFSIKSINDRQEQEKNHGIGAWLNDNLKRSFPRRQARSDSKHGSFQVHRTSLPADDPHPATASAVTFSAIGSPTFSAPSQSTKANPRDLASDSLDEFKAPARMSETLTSVKIALIREFHQKNLVRQVWVQWQNKALRLLDGNRNLENLAKHRDRQVLFRQAFDSWRSLIDERWQVAETERFFEHLERRASRARDLFLLTKAFTHWAYSASDEVQKISLARRHILRTRFFKAWREITAVSELKVRRQILRRFYSAWRRRFFGITLSAEKAVVSFTHNLVQRIFWSWFWAFCQRRAPLWWAEALQRTQLAIWVQRAKRYRELEYLVLENYRHNILQKTYFVWKGKALNYNVQLRQASEFRRTSSIRMAMVKWELGLRLLPLLNNLLVSRKLSLQRASLNLLAVRARQEIEAAAIDRLKIMREAFLAWSDKLRCQAIQLRIKDRLALQGIYRWVLAERLVLAQRLLERRIMRVSLAKMGEALHIAILTDARDASAVQRFAQRRLLMNAVRRWQSALGTNKLHENLASNVINPKILNEILTKWLNRHQQTQRLQNWAHDGHFYFAVSKRLNSWKKALQSLKREKRRTTYSKFRRKNKIKLATKVLLAWRRQTYAITEAESVARDSHYNRKVVFCLEIFDQWRGRAEDVAELASVGEHFLLRKPFNEMKSSLRTHRHLGMAAIRFFEDHATALSTKKWSRFALHLRARQHLVFELREKNAKKTLRKIIIHWRQRAAKQRVWSPTERTRDLSELNDREIEDWADQVDETIASTSLPGYLTTPSKRMPKAAGIAALSSTTPSAPLSTPAERLLRARYSGGSLPYYRRTLGKSSIGWKVTSAAMKDALAREGSADKTVP